MARETPRRQVENAARRAVKRGVYRGRLAEAYDGIGQYVLVSLSLSSVASAYKARVAAGDFGTGQTFPVGTPVTVSVNRGNLEILSLGNKARGSGGCDCPEFCHALTLGTTVGKRLYPSNSNSGTGTIGHHAGWTEIPSAGWASSSNRWTLIPDNTHTGGGNNWDGVNVEVGSYIQTTKSIILSESAELLGLVQTGGTVVGQFRANSRFGIGISESSQFDTANISMEVWRPGGPGRVADLLAPADHGGQRFPPQSTRVNRSIGPWEYSGYPSAVDTDYLVIGMGSYHTSPTGGGTGAGFGYTSDGATDLPEDETTTDEALNSWVELRGTTAPTGTGSHPDLVGTVEEIPHCDHRHDIIEDHAPTPDDDETIGLSIGIRWLDSTTAREWALLDATAGAAVWLEITGGAHSHDIGEITGIPSQFSSATMTIDGGGTVITTGSKGEIKIPFACDLVEIELRSRITGSVVVDIELSDSAGYDTFASVTGGNEPELTTDKISTVTDFTGWSQTSFEQGDILTAVIDSVTDVERLFVTMTFQKSTTL